MGREWIKLRRPLTLWCAILSPLLIAGLAYVYVTDANTSYLPWISDLRELQQSCGDDPECLSGEQLLSTKDQVRNVQQQFAYARMLRTPGGLGVATAGHFSSLIGIVLVGAIAAAHVGGEKAGGTARLIVARDPRRRILAVRKLITVWLASVAIMLLTWALLSAALPPLLDGFDPLPPGPHPSLIQGVVAIARAALILGVLAGVGTAAGLITGGVLPTAGTLLIGAIASLALGIWPQTMRVSPAYWISTWMDFRPAGLRATYLWASSFPVLDPVPASGSQLQAGLALTLLGAAAALLALEWLQRSEIR